MTTTELVLLADEAGMPIGTAPKAEVHTTDTPLHFAFSCYAIDARGRTLITRRSLEKRAWPGVWTNTCCGHPGPGEDTADAVRRRMREELSLEVGDLRLVLPEFRYRAVDASGIVENEICPVYVARVDVDPVPDPAEVAEWAWIPLEDFHTAVAAAPMAFSPWSVLQLDELRATGLLAPGGR